MPTCDDIASSDRDDLAGGYFSPPGAPFDGISSDQVPDPLPDDVQTLVSCLERDRLVLVASVDEYLGMSLVQAALGKCGVSLPRIHLADPEDLRAWLYEGGDTHEKDGGAEEPEEPEEDGGDRAAGNAETAPEAVGALPGDAPAADTREPRMKAAGKHQNAVSRPQPTAAAPRDMQDRFVDPPRPGSDQSVVDTVLLRTRTHEDLSTVLAFVGWYGDRGARWNDALQEYGRRLIIVAVDDAASPAAEATKGMGMPLHLADWLGAYLAWIDARDEATAPIREIVERLRADEIVAWSEIRVKFRDHRRLDDLEQELRKSFDIDLTVERQAQFDRLVEFIETGQRIEIALLFVCTFFTGVRASDLPLILGPILKGEKIKIFPERSAPTGSEWEAKNEEEAPAPVTVDAFEAFQERPVGYWAKCHITQDRGGMTFEFSWIRRKMRRYLEGRGALEAARLFERLNGAGILFHSIPEHANAFVTLFADLARQERQSVAEAWLHQVWSAGSDEPGFPSSRLFTLRMAELLGQLAVHETLREPVFRTLAFQVRENNRAIPHVLRHLGWTARVDTLRLVHSIILNAGLVLALEASRTLEQLLWTAGPRDRLRTIETGLGVLDDRRISPDGQLRRLLLARTHLQAEARRLEYVALDAAGRRDSAAARSRRTADGEFVVRCRLALNAFVLSYASDPLGFEYRIHALCGRSPQDAIYRIARATTRLTTSAEIVFFKYLRERSGEPSLDEIVEDIEKRATGESIRAEMERLWPSAHGREELHAKLQLRALLIAMLPYTMLCDLLLEQAGPEPDEAALTEVALRLKPHLADRSTLERLGGQAKFAREFLQWAQSLVDMVPGGARRRAREFKAVWRTLKAAQKEVRKG